MIVYFADRTFNILGMATSTGQGMTIYDDTITQEIGTGGANFSASLSYDSENRKHVEACTKEGNYILYKDERIETYFTIINSEIESGENKEVYIYAEEAGLDLLNEVALPYEAPSAQPISFYINMWGAGDTGFEIGINEVSSLTRKLKWEGEDTLMKRLLSIATQFDNSEIGFSFKVKELTVTNKYINIYKKIGEDDGVTVRMDRDVSKIVTKKSIENLATALYVTGGTPENSEEPITLNGFTYDDGRFFNQGPWLKDRESVKVWSRYLAKSETGDGTGHIMGTYSYDTLSQSELCNRAISHLKKVCEPEVNYEVDIALLPKNVKIGDRINVVDREGELYLSARVLKLEYSNSDYTGKATLGEYLIKSSGISQTVQSLANQFAAIAKDRIRYTWTAYADDASGTNITLYPDGKTYMGIANNRKSYDPDISNPSIYKWSLIKGASGIILSATAPTDPEVGQLWQTATGEPIKRWDGESWVIHYLSVENLDVQTLSAITANLGIVTAATIKNKDETFIMDTDKKEIVSIVDRSPDDGRDIEGALFKNGMITAYVDNYHPEGGSYNYAASLSGVGLKATSYPEGPDYAILQPIPGGGMFFRSNAYNMNIVDEIISAQVGVWKDRYTNAGQIIFDCESSSAIQRGGFSVPFKGKLQGNISPTGSEVWVKGHYYLQNKVLVTGFVFNNAGTLVVERDGNLYAGNISSSAYAASPPYAPSTTAKITWRQMSETTHTHDERYFTETEMKSKIKSGSINVNFPAGNGSSTWGSTSATINFGGTEFSRVPNVMVSVRTTSAAYNQVAVNTATTTNCTINCRRLDSPAATLTVDWIAVAM